MAEKLGFDQFLWNGRRIDLDKRRSFSLGLGMYSAGHKLFARTAFARYKDTAVGRSNDRYLFAKRPHRDRFSDHHVSLGKLLLKLDIRDLKLALADGVFHCNDGAFET